MLTIEQLEAMPEDTIFATGTANDDPDGLFMANTNRSLRWVAVRGGIADWAVYCHFADRDAAWIARHGDKVRMEHHIRQCVPCTDAAFAQYRY